MRTIALSVVLASSVAVLTGCPKQKGSDEPMTQSEAAQALEESTADSQAASLTTSSVEISTNFTLGKAVTDAAAELKTFIASQLPCAKIDLTDNKLTVTYGALPGNCVYNGHQFKGTHAITVVKNEDVIEVDHEWTDLSNGIVKVSGTAHVTWDFDGETRHVVHDLTWTRIKDGRTGHGTGDRTQKPLAGGLTEGIQVDGSRTWTGAAGRWDLSIEGVQMRWRDPVPQAGAYHLATPKGRSITMSFERIDADSIQVTLASGDKSFAFTVNSAGDSTPKS